MRELNKSTHWEEFFIQEALELEEKMKSLDAESLNKSKLRICLEHGILEWPQYERWCTSQIGVHSLKTSVPIEDITRFVQLAQDTEFNYSQYDFWGPDLIPLTLWENQLIVLGLQYNEKLVALGELIFILTPPEILAAIRRKMADQKFIEQSAQEIVLDSDEEINDALEGLNLNQAAPKISFSLIQPSTAATAETPAEAIEISSSESDTAIIMEPVTTASTAAPAAASNPTPASPATATVKPTVVSPETATLTPVAVVVTPSVDIAKAPARPTEVTGTTAESAKTTKTDKTEVSIAKPIPSLFPNTASASQSPSLFANSAVPQETREQEQIDVIWDFIAERHQEYSFEIKKQFDAFVVLKIKNKTTQVFRMDADMTRQNINQVIFEYNLTTEGPFKQVYENQCSDTFTLPQLELFLYDYQHACITPLMRGKQVVGFFVGLKKNPLSQQDQSLLEELAEETAS